MLKPIFISSVLLLSTTAVLADDTSTELANSQLSNNPLLDKTFLEKKRKTNEATGLFSGALIGGLIAGPPGAIIAGTVGAIIGNSTSSQQENDQLHASLADTQSAYLALQKQQAALSDLYQLALAKQADANRQMTRVQVNPAVQANCCIDSEVTLHFKTNSAVIESHYQQSLQALAQLSKQTPKVIVEIFAYADRRGRSENNNELSQRRVNSVKNSLIKLGVNEALIQSQAFGESEPVNSAETIEGNFFDRRVDVKITPNKQVLLTQTQAH